MSGSEDGSGKLNGRSKRQDSGSGVLLKVLDMVGCSTTAMVVEELCWSKDKSVQPSHTKEQAQLTKLKSLTKTASHSKIGTNGNIGKEMKGFNSSRYRDSMSKTMYSLWQARTSSKDSARRLLISRMCILDTEQVPPWWLPNFGNSCIATSRDLDTSKLQCFAI